jgi:hypothetical protein
MKRFIDGLELPEEEKNPSEGGDPGQLYWLRHHDGVIAMTN